MSKVNLDNLFAGYDEASAASGGGQDPKINAHHTGPANLVVEVVNVEMFPSEQYAAIYYKVAYKVLETDNDKVIVGRTYAWLHDMTNKFFGQSGTKNFIAAAAGLDVDDPEVAESIDRATTEDSWSEEQPLAGCKVCVKIVAKTSKGGFAISPHDWTAA
jgi:hypothetical protein